MVDDPNKYTSIMIVIAITDTEKTTKGTIWIAPRSIKTE